MSALCGINTKAVERSEAMIDKIINDILHLEIQKDRPLYCYEIREIIAKYYFQEIEKIDPVYSENSRERSE